MSGVSKSHIGSSTVPSFLSDTVRVIGGHVDSSVLYASRDGMAANSMSDRKSTRLNSSHVEISYAVFCLKKKRKTQPNTDGSVQIVRGFPAGRRALSERYEWL